MPRIERRRKASSNSFSFSLAQASTASISAIRLDESPLLIDRETSLNWTVGLFKMA